MSTERVRQMKLRIAQIARAENGAHYVWGAYGNIPTPTTVPDSHIFPGGAGRRVKMWTGEGRGLPQPTQEIHHAAYTHIGGTVYVCGGRCNKVQQFTRGETIDGGLVHELAGGTWERPDQYITARSTVFGEACEGIRHFDCVGFVNWCYWRVTGRAVRYSITQWRSSTVTQPVDMSDLEPGDILAAEHANAAGNNQRHIGIFLGNGMAAEARSYRIGVEMTPFSPNSPGKWDYAGQGIPALFG